MRQHGKTAVTLDWLLRNSQGTVFQGCHIIFFYSLSKTPVHAAARTSWTWALKKKVFTNKYYIADLQTENISSCSLANLNRPRHGLGSEISLGQALICTGSFVQFENQGNIQTLSNVYLKYVVPSVLIKSRSTRGQWSSSTQPWLRLGSWEFSAKYVLCNFIASRT